MSPSLFRTSSLLALALVGCTPQTSIEAVSVAPQPASDRVPAEEDEAAGTDDVAPLAKKIAELEQEKVAAKPDPAPADKDVEVAPNREAKGLAALGEGPRSTASTASAATQGARGAAGGEAGVGRSRGPSGASGLEFTGTVGNGATSTETFRSPPAVTSGPPPAKPVERYDRPVTLPVVESNTEDFKDYGVNGFTLVEQDALSTFAVDVDTASYTVSRRKLREGYLPPQAAVRVEEFVNYFPYEYRQPKASDPFSVDVEAAPSPYNAQNYVVRIGVQGRRVDLARKPVNLTFLVDVSGSMQSPDKLGMVKDTLKMLTKELEDGDTVAIATYAGSQRVVLDPTPISQREKILTALDGLTAGGGTAMGAGIDLAYGLADLKYSSGSVNRVIIASDGDANVGVTSHTELTAKIKGYAQKGITLTTLGFGNGNYKDTMMERLANEGDGNYYYIDSLQESRRLFVDKLSSTLEVIAKDVKIQVDWNPGAVIAYRLIGYENRDVADRDFRNDAVDAGEIGAGHQVTALYEVALRDTPTGGLGTVRVRNKAPGPDAPAVERSTSMETTVIRRRFEDASPQFRLASAAMGFAELLRGSPYMNEVTFGQVQAIARAAQRVEYPEDAELVELIGVAARLRGEGSMVQR